VRKALAETGLQVQVAEGGEGLVGNGGDLRPLSVVIAAVFFCGECRICCARCARNFPDAGFLIAERGGDVPDEARPLAGRAAAVPPSGGHRTVRRCRREIGRSEAELASEVSEQMEAVHAAEEVAPEIRDGGRVESEPPPPSTESINQWRR